MILFFKEWVATLTGLYPVASYLSLAPAELYPPESEKQINKVISHLFNAQLFADIN